ncbi:MAG: hypothetical protein KDA24_25950, partial [Deltaproteobacteria bacterium]|nr:hypothetical protein [Deltaproteobacteria bacterium]
ATAGAPAEPQTPAPAPEPVVEEPEQPTEQPEGASVAAEEPTPEPTPAPEPDPKPAPTPKPKARTVEASTPKPKPKPAPTPAPEPVATADSVEPGILHISARPRCRIQINDQDRGTSDETRLGVVLEPGKYNVRFVCDEAEPECAQFKHKSGRKTIEVRSGEKSRYHADFYRINEKRK